MCGDDEDLAERIARLEDAVADLESRTGRRRTRPPSTRDVLRFAHEYAIPTAVAALEANRRALEATGAALRALDAGEAAEDVELPTGRAGVLDALDRVVADLEDAIAGGEPPDPEARAILSEARALREDVRARLREPGERTTRGVEIDVEEELETIRESVDREDSDDDGE